jgi:hypothetical protein
MKKLTYYRSALLLVTLCAALAGCGTSNTGSSGTAMAAATGENASLIIRRAANMGTGLFLNVSIDDTKVSALGPGQTYKGTLSPGEHVVSVLLIPNNLHLSPTKMILTADKGQSYAFTAMWEGQTVILK